MWYTILVVFNIGITGLKTFQEGPNNTAGEISQNVCHLEVPQEVGK